MHVILSLVLVVFWVSLADAAPVFRQYSHVAATSATSAVVDKPTGTVDNDIMLVWVYIESDTAITAPSGWTEAVLAENNKSGEGFRCYAYWKRASSEPASWTWSWSGSSFRSAMAASYSGVPTGGTPYTIAVSSVAESDVTTYPSISSQNTTDTNELLVWTGCAWDGGHTANTPPTGFTERNDIAGSVLYLTDKGQAVSGAMGTVSGASYNGGIPDPTAAILISLKSGETTGSDTEPPTTPGIPGLTVVSTSQINLSWAASTDDVGVTGYQVERCTGAGCTTGFTQLPPVTGTPPATAYNDTGLSASTTYGYRVRAQDAAGKVSGYTAIAYAPTSSTSSQQWQPSGAADLVYTTGSVGIGVTPPDSTNNTKLHVAGGIRVDGNIAAKYQDVAEWVPSAKDLDPGTVVVLDITRSNVVSASLQPYDTRVAGVVSDMPGILLGEAGADKVKVATTGRVKVKVDATNRPIVVGDLLVTSATPGMAMRSEPLNVAGTPLHRPGTLIGKALESLAEGEGEILVLLSLQ